MQDVSVSWLKAIEVLKDVPDEQLQWLIDNGQNQVLKDGDLLFEPGSPLTGPHFIIAGRLRLYMPQNSIRSDLTEFATGDITGYLPFSRGKISKIVAKAVGELQLLTLPTNLIPDMIRTQFDLTEALVHVMSNRVRDYTALQQQNEKMMALGKLSAGLAHELNNPASAIVRDSISLKEHLRLTPDTFKKLVAIQMTEQHIDAVNNLLFTKLDAAAGIKLTLKQRTTLEDELGDWLDEKKIDNAFNIAENMVEFGFIVDELEAFAVQIPPEYLSPVFNWINNNLVTEKMVEDIQEASERISTLVASVKTFTHMDRAQDKQLTDIHSGIKNTLTMLAYKLKKGNITVVKEWDDTLPQVMAQVGELNQVWTNLVDNAIDAMEDSGKGTLTIKTKKDGEFVKVSVIDNGPGIPEDVKPRIFDPFFTTKEIGKGSGMGLEVVQRIIRQHRGSIKVDSAPGQTSFIICFPIAG